MRSVGIGVVLVAGLAGCDLEALQTQECEGRRWEGGSSLVDLGAAVDPETAEWIAGLDGASIDAAEVDFPDATCFDDTWTVDVESEADEVRAAVWNLDRRTLGPAIPLERGRGGEWTGELPGACREEDRSTVVVMPVTGGVWGRPEGTNHGAISGTSTISAGGAPTHAEVGTEGVDAVELLVLDLRNGEAAGPSPLLQTDETYLGLDWWAVREVDRVCREDGDFLLFGFLAMAKERVVGAWGL